MNGYWIFIFAFVALGVYCIIYSVVRLGRLDHRSHKYYGTRKQLRKNIVGGVGLIFLGLFIYLTRVVFNPWN